MTTHKFRLNDPWFQYMKNGKKIYEGRRSTNRINLIQVGDTIQFSRVLDPTDYFQVTVSKILSFQTFRDALLVLPLEQVLPNIETIDIGVEIYYKYVSLHTQLKDGVKMFLVTN